MLLSTTRHVMMISANDLIALYMGLELKSLALYVIASFHRETCARPRRASSISSSARCPPACCSMALAGLRLHWLDQLRRHRRGAHGRPISA
ncbi:MAG: hypothetical protein QM722_01580 [Piscinibacter sp.]